MSTTTTDQSARTRAARAEGPRLPTLGELNRATAEIATVMANPAADVHDKYRAAEREMATTEAFRQRHGSQVQADMERLDLEMEAG